MTISDLRRVWRPGHTLIVVCAVGWLSLASQVAIAGIIFDNGAPNQTGGNELTLAIQAEDFTFSQAKTVTDVRFWDLDGNSSGGWQGAMTWFIYADAGGLPGAVIATGTAATVLHTATGNTVSGWGNEYQNDFSIGAVSLAAGTYWLGLHNGPLSLANNHDVYWEATNANSTVTGRELAAPFNGTWGDTRGQHAFELLSVPEPSTMTLAMLGLASAGFARLRTRNRRLQRHAATSAPGDVVSPAE